MRPVSKPYAARKPWETGVPVAQANRQRANRWERRKALTMSGIARGFPLPAHWPDASAARSLWVIINAPWYKMLGAIETQIAAAEADATGEPYTKLTSRYTTNEETGERVKKEVPMPVRRCWWKDVSGNVVLNVRYGNRRVELKPGKSAIEVGEREELVPALAMLADAVKVGELDEVLLAMKSKRRAPQRKSR